VRFLLEASDDGAAWEAVGASGVVLAEGGRATLLPGRTYAGARPGARATLDMRPTPLWLAAWGLPLLAAGAMQWVATMASAAGRGHWAKDLSAAGYAAHGALLVALGAARGAAAGPDGGAAAAAACLVRATCGLLLAAVLWAAERRLAYAVAPAGAYFILAELAAALLLEGGGEAPAPAAAGRVATATLVHFGAVLAAFGLLCLAARRRFLAKADALVRPDRDRYDDIWRRLLARPEVPAALADLARVAAPHAAGHGPRPRQRELPPAHAAVTEFFGLPDAHPGFSALSSSAAAAVGPAGGFDLELAGGSRVFPSQPRRAGLLEWALLAARGSSRRGRVADWAGEGVGSGMEMVLGGPVGSGRGAWGERIRCLDRLH
jgi:hypothetical protein